MNMAFAVFITHNPVVAGAWDSDQQCQESNPHYQAAPMRSGNVHFTLFDFILFHNIKNRNMFAKLRTVAA